MIASHAAPLVGPSLCRRDIPPGFDRLQGWLLPWLTPAHAAGEWVSAGGPGFPQQARSLSLYDALIVAAALDSACTTLYSEDLNDGETVRGLRIINPF
ncbi:hypothetical protein [Ottowia testudinis]|uniref:PIN domain-containing protein n=1 Tax=Ottowia testudinis TaxID=2816950 RepID=A0A975CI10_9BURK|nr:hypothetical protein [Ottowia testudinis]QTD46730.1 hypothetical protein J1M35_07620 [Ottowia testudinis]